MSRSALNRAAPAEWNTSSADVFSCTVFHGNSLDFEVGIEEKLVAAKKGASGQFLPKETSIYGIEAVPQRDVRAKYLHVREVVHSHAGLVQDCPQTFHHIVGLHLDTGRYFAGSLF